MKTEKESVPPHVHKAWCWSVYGIWTKSSQRWHRSRCYYGKSGNLH